MFSSISEHSSEWVTHVLDTLALAAISLFLSLAVFEELSKSVMGTLQLASLASRLTSAFVGVRHSTKAMAAPAEARRRMNFMLTSWRRK